MNISSCVIVKKCFEVQGTALLFPLKKAKAEMKITVKSPKCHQPVPQAGVTFLPHLTSQLSLEKEAQTGCKGPGFPNKQLTKSYFAT